MRKLGLLLLVLAACSQSAPPPPTAHGWTLAGHTRVGQTPGNIVLGGHWAFVANMSDGTVSQLDRANAHVVATIKVADPSVLRDQGCAPDSVHNLYSGSWGWRACDTPYAITWDGSALWALDNGNRALWRIDPSRHIVNDRVRLPGTGWSVVIKDGVAYVSGFADAHALYVADLKAHQVTTLEDLDSGPAMLTADSAGVWVNCVRANTGHLDLVDPHLRQVVRSSTIEWWSSAVTSDAGAIYVRGTYGGDISRVDPSTGNVTWTKPGPGFIGRQGMDELGPAADGIWMSGPTTSRVDLATGEIVDKIHLPSASVATGDKGEVWLVELDGTVAKFQLK